MKTAAANRKTEVPPLSQSRQTWMACPTLYAQCGILGRRVETPWAERGQQIHEAISKYISHLVASRQKTDLDYLRELIAQIGNQEAAEVLQTFAEQQPMFDPQRVLGTELHIELDENFMAAGDLTGDPQDVRPVFEGRLDLVQLESPTAAVIDDWKSFYRIVDADTFQGRLYTLLLFATNPALEKVRFRLNFVRYGVSREVTYVRGDAEKLRKEIERERNRQLEIHAQHQAGETLAAFPGGHCAYCPLLQTGECPVRQTNPMGMSAEERVKFRLWLDAQAEENDEALKAWVGEKGPVEYQDGNGVKYQARYESKEKTRYPLMPTVQVVADWNEDGLEEKLYVGASELKPLLKAKKRAALAEAVARVAEVSTVTEFKVGKSKEPLAEYSGR